MGPSDGMRTKSGRRAIYTHQTRDKQVADDNGSHGPPALLLAGVKKDHAPEHVQQDDGHGHES